MEYFLVSIEIRMGNFCREDTVFIFFNLVACLDFYDYYNIRLTSDGVEKLQCK